VTRFSTEKCQCKSVRSSLSEVVFGEETDVIRNKHEGSGGAGTVCG
jgi:hypothetical protein